MKKKHHIHCIYNLMNSKNIDKLVIIKFLVKKLNAFFGIQLQLMYSRMDSKLEPFKIEITLYI